MNYDAKPYVPVFSPPGQYMAHIPSPNAANLPTSYHLFPVKCSQGMIQTSPENRYKPIYYTTPPPLPSSWVCNFHSPPVPSVAAFPFIDGQPMISGLKNSTSPPRFHIPLLQENRKSEFQPGSWHTPKAQSPESVFKQAALRNGIRVEECPKKGKVIMTSEEKESNSRNMLSNNQGDDSSIRPKAFSREQDERQDSLPASCRDISLPSSKTNAKLFPEDDAISQTCSEHTIFESSSTTQTCIGVDEERLAGDEPETLRKKFSHAQLNPDEFCKENEGMQLESAKTITICHPSEGLLETSPLSFNGSSPEVNKCDSKMVPSVVSNTDVEDQGSAIENKIISLDPPNEVSIEDFVLNVIFCAVNSLLQESRNQDNTGFDLKMNGDGQEQVVGKITDLLMDSKVDDDGIAHQVEGEMDAFVRPVLDNKIESNSVFPTNDCKDYAEKTPNQAESLPYSTEAISNPNEPVPYPAEAMLSPNKPVPYSTEAISNPNKPVPYPAEAMLSPNKPVPYSTEAISNPNKPVPYPAEAMLSPNKPVPYSTEAISNPNEPMPYPAEAMLSPNKPVPYSTEAISNPNEPMPYSEQAISNPNEPMSHPVEAILNPNESMFIPDETLPNSTEQVPILSESIAHKAEAISSNDLHDPVEDASCCEDEATKSTEDQEVEDIFVKLALKKGIKVGNISPPTRNDVKAVSVSESSQRENFFSQKDTEVENLFIRRALEKGIKVGRLSPTNTGFNAKPVHLPEVSVREKEKDQDIEELFVRLALEKGIKVGNVSTVNETSIQHHAKDTIPGKEFEKRALRNGIRLGGSHISTMAPSNGSTISFPPGTIPGHIANDMDVLKMLTPKPNTNIAFLNGDWLNPLTTPMPPSHDGEGVFGPNVVPPFARYDGTQFNTLVKFDTESHGKMDWTNDDEAGYRKTTSLRQDGFEELAKRNGIRVGETLKRKVESQTQTENSFKSQDTQTIGLIKVGNALIQVDVTKEAFKAEYDEWMQEELSLIDPKASSFRELFLLEEEARAEAERRLAVEMDENVKAQRNTKILIDELKDQLANKEEAMEKLTKELKSLKKQKDNEIKRLIKEIKQKDEDLKTATNENSLKDVVIENMREIAKDQNEMVEKMEEKLKAMERQMENERKISESLFKIESSKNISLQTKCADEWQVVKGRYSGTKATMKPNSSLQYHQVDGLSGFDDIEYQRYNNRLPSNATIYVKQRDPSEEIKPEESLASKNEGFLSTSQDVPLHLLEAQNSVTSDIGVSTAYNQQSPSGDYVPRLSRLSSHATGCTSAPSLPPPGIHMPRLPRDLCPVSVCTPNTSSINSVCTINGTFNTAIVLNSNGLYTSSNTLTSPSIMQQNLPRVQYPTPGSTGNASLFHPIVSHQVLPGGPYNIPTVSDATTPSFIVTNQDLPRLPYPSPASSCDTPLPPPGITVDPALRQALPVVSPKNKTTNKFSSFDKLMDTLRDSFPDHSRPSLMVYLKKTKEAFGTNGFKGKQISEIVDKVAQGIDQE